MAYTFALICTLLCIVLIACEQKSSCLQPLKVRLIPLKYPKYNRQDYGDWITTNCRDTRDRVLLEESLIAPVFKTSKNCTIVSGLWYDPYSGLEFTKANDMDVDHFVPLENAHISGGYLWDKDKKHRYANDIIHSDHLIAVSKTMNRQKKAKGPDQWKPPNRHYWCAYAEQWTQIKKRWDLSATTAEWAALEEMAIRCSYSCEGSK